VHLHARYTGADLLLQAASRPFGPRFTAAQGADPNTLEVWVTSFEDTVDTAVGPLF
jgi:hypothetical protein